VNENERVRRIMDKEAPRYDRQMNFCDRVLFTGGREWICGGAEGDILEIAIGSGRNLPVYPEGTKLTGIEFSPEMLKLAKQRAGEIAGEVGGEIDLRLGDAQALEFDDETFDTVVCCLALCTIPDPARAVREAHRVLRPGGTFRALEHVRSPALLVRGVQRAIDRLSVRFAGDHLLREPLEYLRPAGFEIEHLERSKWGIVERVVARKPAMG
jgi:ubiquinone/menaquinone biosynthesis C-methylase UbiE